MHYTFHHYNCFAKQSLCDDCSIYCYQIEESCAMDYIVIRYSLRINPTHTQKKGNRKQPRTDIKSEVFNISLPSNTSRNLCKPKVQARMYQRIYPAELRSTHIVYSHHPRFRLRPDTPVCSTKGSIYTHTPQDVHHCCDL